MKKQTGMPAGIPVCICAVFSEASSAAAETGRYVEGSHTADRMIPDGKRKLFAGCHVLW